MGEKDAAGKNDGEKKPAAAAADGLTTVVLKLDMHCDGCAKKIKRAVKKVDGVSSVTADSATNKVMVIGKVDPAGIREKLEQKTKKKVELVSPQPKKDGGGGDKKPEEKPAEKKAEEKKAEEKKPKESTVVLKINLHCDGCIQKIRKIIYKIKGVDTVEVDASKDLVTVKGTMDTKELAPYLTVKLKRSVDVVAPKKDDGGGDKKGKEAAPAGGGDKKEKKADGGDKKKEGDGKAAPAGGDAGKKDESGGPKVEVNKMEYSGLGQPSSVFYYDGPVSAHNRYVMEAHAHQAYVSQVYDNQGYPNHGSVVPMENYAPQMFSDENPNASCSVM
ncbi:hypothetical protein UlMin_005810 [Ulmus minor]